jgi:PST family polysaccharide transporter
MCRKFINLWKTVLKSKNLKLILNFNWLIAEKIIRLFFGIYIGALVARYLGPEDYGLLNYSIAFVIMYSAFADFGLDNIIVKDLVNNKLRKNIILTTTFTIKAVTGLLGACLAISTAYYLNNEFNLGVTLTAIVSISLIFYSFNVIDLWFQSIVKSKFTVLAKTISYIIGICMKIIFILLKLPLIYFAIIYSIEYLLIAMLLFSIYIKSNKIIFNFSFDYAKSIIKKGLPLLISSIAVLLIMNVDKIMLGKMIGNREVGIFSIAANLSMMLYFIPVIIGSTFMPSLVTNWRTNKIQFNKTLNIIFGISTIVGLVFFAIGYFAVKPFILLVYGLEYSDSINILIIHLLTFIFVSHVSIRNRVLVIADKLFLVSIYSAFTLLFNIVLNFIFIPKHGALGAVFASLLSWMFSVLLIPLFSKHTISYPKLFFKSIKYIFINSYKLIKNNNDNTY